MTAESSPWGESPPSGAPEEADLPLAPPVPLADAAAPIPEDPAEQAFSLLLSGELKFRQRNLLEAESYLRRAVELHRRLPDADPTERLRALDALGAVHVARGDLAQAEPVLREALGIADALLGHDHDDLGVYLNSLAHVLFKRRRFAEAEPVLARLVALKRRLGDEHPEVASVVANLALVHEALHRYDSAETLWRCALSIRERSLPDDSPAVIMACEHLADCCATNGRPGEAIALRERALAARSRSLPPAHPQVAAAKAKLTALRLEGVRERIPVVVPQARSPEPSTGARRSPPIMRPPARTPAPRSATPPLPRDVLDEIVRATTDTPGRGVMAGMKGRARDLIGRPLLRLITPRRGVPDDVAGPVDEFDEEDLVDVDTRRPPREAPVASRPAPRVVMPVARPVAESVPEAWDDDDLLGEGDDRPDDEDFQEPPRRFDLFGDALWPRTRLVLAAASVLLVVGLAAVGVARMDRGATPAASAASTPPAAEPASPGSAQGVSEETRRIMDAGLRAAQRSAASSR